MPRKRSNSRKPQNQPADAVRDAKELFGSLRPQIRVTVEQVCARLNSHPQPAEREDFVEEIDLLLRENDYARLRSFHGDSAPETWLFSVAKNHIGKQLRRQSRLTSLDGLPPDLLVVAPDQEPIAILHEMERIALGEHSTLTPGEKRLFNLWREELNDPEIAEILDREVVTVRSKKSRMLRKIREMAGWRGKEK